MNALLQNILDQLRGIWRFRWWAMAVAWFVCLLGWVGVLLMPDAYEASARVFVDTRTTLGQVTQGLAVDANVDMQIQRVRQALVGGPELDKVAREAGISSVGLTQQEWQEVLNKLRERIQITGTSTRESAGSGLYVISFQDRSRDLAKRVVDRVLNNFVESTFGGKRQGSEEAQRFLEEEIAKYERRLAEAEERLAGFKKQNVGLMPGAQGDYFSRLQAEMERGKAAETQLTVAQNKREELKRQLQGGQPVFALPAVSGATATTGGGGDTVSRIRETQGRLDDLLLRFTDKHPDVIALRQTLRDLEARQKEEIEAIRRGDAGAAAGAGLAANPVFQNIQNELNKVEVEIAALRAQLSDSRRKTDELKRLVNTAPEVEAEFTRLNRDYDVTRDHHKQLMERLVRARLSENADATGVIKFDIVDPPDAAYTPVAPNRVRLIILVLFGGLGMGAGLAYLLHMMKPVFATSRQLSELTGLPVLGVVSITWLERHKAVVRKGALVYAGAAGLLLMVAGVVFTGYRPIMQMLRQLTGQS